MTITIPSHLTDDDLMAAAPRLAGYEREVTAQLVAHLAEIDARRLYVPAGYSSLYTYCRERLGYSEDAAHNRKVAARVARRYPAVIDRLADGRLSLTAVKLLAPVLNDDNWEAICTEAAGLSKRDVEKLVVRLEPEPDVPSTIRRLPAKSIAVPGRPPDGREGPVTPAAAAAGAGVRAASETGGEPARGVLTAPAPRPIVAPLAPERYRVQFTIGEETEKKLRRIQQLLRREIPSGDPAAIFDLALDLLLAKTESRKEGTLSKANPAKARARTVRPLAPGSRRVPAATRRVVVPRDGGQCTYVSPDGRRCTARVYLEFHHAGVAFARGGGPDAANIALHCRAHNAWEGRRLFGDHLPREVRAARVQYDAMLASQHGTRPCGPTDAGRREVDVPSRNAGP